MQSILDSVTSAPTTIIVMKSSIGLLFSFFLTHVIISLLTLYLFDDVNATNALFSNSIFLLEVILISQISKSNLKDAIRISLTYLYTLVGGILVLVAWFIKPETENNISLLIIIIAFSLQALIVQIFRYFKTIT